MSLPIFHMVSGAPDPVAPFSHAVESDGWIFVTGQMPFTGTANTSAYPARTCVGVTALARGARVEIDFIARRP